MRFELLVLTLCVSLTGCYEPSASRSDPSQHIADLVIENGNIVDLETGSVINDQAIVIDGDTITSIVPSDRIIPARRRVSANDGYIIPGLWDMHVHISDQSFFPLFIENGITGVRDMGGSLSFATDGCGSIKHGTLQDWKNEIRSGTLIGPEIVSAGSVLSARPSATNIMVPTPEAAREAVKRVAAEDSDFVKVYEDIRPEVFRAIMAAASEEQLVVAGHVSEETLTVLEALMAGQRSVEHVRSHLLLCFAEDDQQREELFISDNWDDEDRAWAERHVTQCPDMWAQFRSGGAWLTPTLAVQETMVSGATLGFDTDARRDRLPASIVNAVLERSARQRALPEAVIAEYKNWNAFIFRLVDRANSEGVPLLAGSDAACEGVIPGYGLHRELELMVEAGLTPLQALRSATVEPAKYFEREHELGQIQSGYRADLLILAQNPLDEISATSTIKNVIVSGQLVISKAAD